MFVAWGRVVARRPWVVLVLSGLTLAVSLAGLALGGTLANASAAQLESSRAAQLMQGELPRQSDSSFAIIFGWT